MTKILTILIFITFLLIINKVYPGTLKNIKTSIFSKSISFIKINKLSKNIIGRDIFYEDNKEVKVLSNEYDLNSIRKYYDAEEFKVSTNLPIGAIESGVVIFVGEKDNYGTTIIIEGVDGYNIWYSNITDINIKLYDYIEKGSLIANAKDSKIYLLIEKDNKIYSYNEYKENKD